MMKQNSSTLFLLVLSFLFVVCFAEYERYDNHQVLRVNITSQEQIDKIEEFGFDVWSRPLIIGFNDIRIAPHEFRSFLSLGASYEVMIGDVQRLVEEQLNPATRTTASTVGVDDPFYNSYHRFSGYVSKMQEFASDYSFVSLLNLGYSVQNRIMYGMVISANPEPNKPTFFLSCAQHAREWITTPTCMFLVQTLLEGYGNDNEITGILDGLDIFVVPVSNPDGLEYTHTNNRMWRKNRQSPPQGSSYYGVDLNRNWDYHWGGGGSSGNPSSDTYRGPSPGSEPEIKALVSFFNSARGSNRDLRGAIDMHSYSQLLLRPWGDTRTDCKDEAFHQQTAAMMRSLIHDTHNKWYTNQKSIDLYVTTGTASDYYYAVGSSGKLGFLSYTIELRDTGSYGFLLPPSQIVPTGEEIVNAMKFFLQELIPGKK